MMRTVAGLMVKVSTVTVTSLLIGAATLAAQADDLDSGGIGLSRDAWEDVYGDGEVLQSIVQYESPEVGLPVYVGFEDDRVAHIEFRYSETQRGGLLEEDAIDLVESALPADAILIDEFAVPATPEGPMALRARRWGSNALGYVTGGETSILVIYQEKLVQQNPGSDPEIVIPAVTLTVAEPASGR